MKKGEKIGLTSLILIVLLSLSIGVFKAFNSNYLVHASFITSALLILSVCVAFYYGVHIIKKIWTYCIILIVSAVMLSCSYAKSNQQVLVSTDCGITWNSIKAGESVPRGTGNPCFQKVVIPNFPMQGDSKFIANLKDRVRATVIIDYDYSIIDPLSFIKQAKYLGKSNANADDNGALDPSAFEGAENMVIDKRLREEAKDLFLAEDIVDLEQSILENKLLEIANKELEPYGVHLNFISLTFDLDEQTRQAIDVATAMKIYQSKGIEDLGKQTIISRAGSNKIVIEHGTTEK